MSADPQQMQQMLAMYKQLYGNPQMGALNQATQGLSQGAPQGTNRTSGAVNGAAQLIAALMKAQKQKQIQQGFDQSNVQQGMPAAQAGQNQAIDQMMQQNPVMSISPGG
jgi:hypothetical protein